LPSVSRTSWISAAVSCGRFWIEIGRVLFSCDRSLKARNGSTLQRMKDH